MLNQEGMPVHSRTQLIIKGLLLALAGFYLLNCFTPLRLHVDMIRYFAIKDCIEYGCPPDSEAAKDYLPYGYTGLLLILSKLHILKSFVIVLINCAYLFFSLYLIRKMFPSARFPFFFMVLVLLNWTIIKFVTHPLSEMQYLFFSVISLYCFYEYTRNKKLFYLLLAFTVGGVAFLTRTVGVALAAALVISLIWLYKTELILLVKKNKILVGVIIAAMIGIVIFSKQLGLNHYTGVMTKQFDDGLTFTDILKWHFTEWAEIFSNTSIVKVTSYLPASVGDWGFLIAGILFFILFIYLVFIRKNKIPFIIKSYLFFYSVLMFNWPFYDPRFWVPVIPLIAVILAGVPLGDKKLLKGIVYVFLTVYVCLGIVSVGYMTYTSLNRETMARRHANGVYRNEYETNFFGKPQSDTARKVDSYILSVLKRYDR